jgi:hypothetical protein
MIVGGLPHNLGVIECDASEMMFIQYMPIQMPGCGLRIPDNLMCFKPLIDRVIRDAEETYFSFNDEYYIYITAKHLYVTPENLGNRPGWHIDGFGTDDINYIWSDGAPENSTEFCDQAFDISEDEHQSMVDMTAQADEGNIVTYLPKTLLRLDNKIVHRTSTRAVAGYRTFVKLSLSKQIYNLKGNAHNYLFDYAWNMIERDAERNVTSK